MITRLFIIALRNIFQHKRGSLLWGTTTVIATASLLVIWGLLDATRARLYESATIFTSGHINVTGIFKHTPLRAAWVMYDVEKVKDVLRRVLPETELIVERIRGDATLSTPSGYIEQASLLGVDVQQERRLRSMLRPIEGTLEGLAEPDSIVLSEEHAQLLGVGVGDVVTLSSQTIRGSYNAIDLKVAAVIHSVGSFGGSCAFVPIDAVRKFYGYPPNSAGVIQVYLPEPLGDVEAYESKVEAALTEIGYEIYPLDLPLGDARFKEVEYQAWVGARLMVTNWTDVMEYPLLLLGLVELLLMFLAGVLMVMAALGLTTGLALAIRARTREIGTLRAMGMGRGSVVGLFVFEGLWLGTLSTIVGIAVGAGLCVILNAAQLPIAPTWQAFLGGGAFAQFSPSANSVGVLLVVVSLLSTTVSVLPSLLAARLQIIRAIQNVETGA